MTQLDDRLARRARLRCILALLCAQCAWPGTLPGQEEDFRGPVVRGLTFSGNRAIDDLTLKVSIATSQSSTFARWGIFRWTGLGEKRYFDETEFRRDVIRILVLYRQSGFREASVDTVVRRMEGDVYVRFVIREGEPVRVRSMTVSGLEEIAPAPALMRRLPLRAGDPFDLLRLQASVDTIRSFLRNRGYPFPEIFRNFDVDVIGHAADVSFEVVPGTRARVSAVNVVGTQEVDADVVRRAMAVRPGQWFNERGLYRSQIDLYRMNLFNFVSVGLVDTVPPDAGDTSVAVQVRVAEAALRRVRLGGGYATVDCVRTLGAWTAYDFLGGGRTLDVSTRLSKIGAGSPADIGLGNSLCYALADEDSTRRKLNYNVTASLREPFFLSRRTSAALAFSAERYSEYQAFVRQAVGGEFSLTWSTPLDIPITATYSLSRAQTDADPATFCYYLNVCRVEDTRIFTHRRYRSVVGLSFVWDRSDSPLDPTHGTRLTGEMYHASTLIGSDSLIQFTRGVVDFTSYHRVGRRAVFAWRVRFGAAGSPRLDLEGGGDRFVPPEDRLYGGGPNSVRGFSQNELGPLVRVLDTILVDPAQQIEDSIIRSSATGGDRLVLANAELRFPLPLFYGRVFGAAFIDAGQVYEHGLSDEGLSDIRLTPGIGFRVVSPLGPMRLDIAYNPYDPRPGPLYRHYPGGELRASDTLYAPELGFLGHFRLHFSVGQAF